LPTRNVLLLATLTVSILAIGPLAGHATLSSSPSPYFDYVLTIILENKGLNDTYGAHCLGNCTYITSLANIYGLAEDYSDIGHPSLPNYLALTNGGNYDRPPFDKDCFPENLTSGCYASGPNIIDSITGSGRSWKAYFEDYKGGCSLSPRTGYYTDSHNPFVYNTDIYTNSTRCGKIVDANPGGSGFLALPTTLLSDLNSTSTASNYMWLTPNLCDDGHTLCAPLNNLVSQANQYLSILVPRILSSKIFQQGDAALFIAWDEAGVQAGKIVTAIWAGPDAKPAYKSTLPYNHYSAIKTIETAWNLQPLTVYDQAATPMTEFLHETSTVGGHIIAVDRLLIILPILVWSILLLSTFLLTTRYLIIRRRA
jgi:hypothetical protein